MTTYPSASAFFTKLASLSNLTTKHKVPRLREPFASEWFIFARDDRLMAVAVPVRMGMEFAVGMRMTMGVDEVRAEQQFVVVQDF
jgi:hypothetical protein